MNEEAVSRCANGAQVIITGRSQEALDAAVADIGNAAFAIRGDVSDLTHHDQVIAEESSVNPSYERICRSTYYDSNESDRFPRGS